MTLPLVDPDNVLRGGRTLVDSGIRILLVDDDVTIASLLADLVERAGYKATVAHSADEAAAAFAAGDFHLVLSDIVMPGSRNGLDLLRELRAHKPDIAVILLSGVTELSNVVEAMRAGAADFVPKPVNNVELDGYRRGLEEKVKEQTAALRAALEAKEAAWEAALQALVDALDAREQETERHSLRVMNFTVLLAREYGVPDAAIADIARGALLHDIGKIGIPDSILLKPAGLTEAEWVVMKSHAEIGWQILRGIEYLASAAEMVHSHQERWDGAGYPRGLKGEQIPLGARLFAIVDAFDAIVSDRPYRKGKPVEWARDEIRRCGGTQFDPKGVEAFLRIPAEEWNRAKLELEQSEKQRDSRRGESLWKLPLRNKLPA